MGEAILTSRAGFQTGGELAVATWGVYLTEAQYVCTKSGNYIVTCVGAGGGGGAVSNTSYPRQAGGGGGSGFINTMEISLQQGESVAITVGNGSTAFGVYCVGNRGQSGSTDGTGGNGSNKGENGAYRSANTVANGGILYYNPSNICQISATQTSECNTKFAYGYGGNGASWHDGVSFSSAPSGGNGYCAIMPADL